MRLNHWIHTVPLRLRSLFYRRIVEQELDDELQFHLDRETYDRVSRGENPQQARRLAVRTLHGMEQCKEGCRDMRRTGTIDSVVRDLAYAVRTLRRSPVFTVTAALTLAMGIGASTAIFSVTNAVLLRPLPYQNPDRLMVLFWENRAGNIRSFLYSNADYLDLRAGTVGIFDDLGGIASFRAFVPREDGSTEQIGKALVTSNFFRLMGAHIAYGRDFTASDAIPQPAEPGVLIPPGSAAILSHEYWQRRYGGSTAVLGQEMRNNGPRGPRIVGVLAPGFKLYFPPASRIDAAPDFWVANNIGYDTAHRNLLTVGAIGRLRADQTRVRAQQQLDRILSEVRKTSFDPGATVRLEPLQKYLVEDVRPTILTLMAAVVLLLLIACGNVANLQLVRMSQRAREVAVRTALGGGPWRLIRQMLAEALLLSGIGTVLGVLLAAIGIRALAVTAPGNVPRMESTAVDWRVLAFAVTAGLAATSIFGAIPALRACRQDAMQVLRGGGRDAGLRSGHRVRDILVVAEIALSFVLLVGSGLLLRSFLALRRVEPGYDPQGLLTFLATREWPLTRQQGRLELLREIQNRLRALPGVESVTSALILPLSGGARAKMQAASKPQVIPASADGADFQQVMTGYFETLRTPLLAGRTFTENDNAPGRNLVVIDELFAARAFPNESAIGKRILLPDPSNPWAEVVGVVAHQRLFSLADPGRQTVFFSDGFWGIGVSRSWIVRTRGDPANYSTAVRAELAKLDPQLVVSKVQTFRALVDQDQAGPRFSLLLVGFFAVVAAILASLGLFGVLATVVRQRNREIGVRIALGAPPSDIVRLVVGHALRLSIAGIAGGWVTALALTRVMASLLVGVSATDLSTFAAIALLFLLLAGAATGIPASRAAGIDPNIALRLD